MTMALPLPGAAEGRLLPDPQRRVRGVRSHASSRGAARRSQTDDIITRTRTKSYKD